MTRAEIEGMEAGEVVRLLELNAYQLYRSTLYQGGPSYLALQEELANPQVGDLVLEWTTMHHRPQDGLRLGYLLRVFEEPLEMEEGWEGDPSEIPTRQIKVIRSISTGEEVRWTNGGFIKVLTEWPEW